MGINGRPPVFTASCLCLMCPSFQICPSGSVSHPPSELGHQLYTAWRHRCSIALVLFFLIATFTFYLRHFFTCRLSWLEILFICSFKVAAWKQSECWNEVFDLLIIHHLFVSSFSAWLLICHTWQIVVKLSIPIQSLCDTIRSQHTSWQVPEWSGNNPPI